MKKGANKEQIKELNILNEIFNFNEQNQLRQKLKVLTPNQTLRRLPISLAQLKAGNNLESLKNEISQLLKNLKS